jgi:hypothetical protein
MWKEIIIWLARLILGKMLKRLLFRVIFNAFETIVLDFAEKKKPELVDELEALFDEIRRTENI